MSSQSLLFVAKIVRPPAELVFPIGKFRKCFFFRKLQEAQTVKRQQSEAQLGSQFGPYDWKIREAEMREKAKRERAEKEGKK